MCEQWCGCQCHVCANSGVAASVVCVQTIVWLPEPGFLFLNVCADVNACNSTCGGCRTGRQLPCRTGESCCPPSVVAVYLLWYIQPPHRIPPLSCLLASSLPLLLTRLQVLFLSLSLPVTISVSLSLTCPTFSS